MSFNPRVTRSNDQSLAFTPRTTTKSANTSLNTSGAPGSPWLPGLTPRNAGKWEHPGIAIQQRERFANYRTTETRVSGFAALIIGILSLVSARAVSQSGIPKSLGVLRVDSDTVYTALALVSVGSFIVALVAAFRYYATAAPLSDSNWNDRQRGLVGMSSSSVNSAEHRRRRSSGRFDEFTAQTPGGRLQFDPIAAANISPVGPAMSTIQRRGLDDRSGWLSRSPDFSMSTTRPSSVGRERESTSYLTNMNTISNARRGDLRSPQSTGIGSPGQVIPPFTLRSRRASAGSPGSFHTPIRESPSNRSGHSSSGKKTAISKASDLDEYLRDYDESHKSPNNNSFTSSPYPSTGAFRNSHYGTSPYSFGREDSKYKFSYRPSPKDVTIKTTSKARDPRRGHAEDVYQRLEITDKLPRWGERMRRWVAIHILSPLVTLIERNEEEMAQLGDPLADIATATQAANSFPTGTFALNAQSAAQTGPSGFSSKSIFGQQQKPSMFGQKKPATFLGQVQPQPTAQARAANAIRARRRVLDQYLNFGVWDRDYTVRRVKDLANGGFLGAFHWNSGGSLESRPWSKEHFPTDAMIVIHLFVTYIDFLLPRGRADGPGGPTGLYGAGTRVHVTQSVESVARTKTPGSDVVGRGLPPFLVQTTMHPPHFRVELNRDITAPTKDTRSLPDHVWEVIPGSRNIFEALALFVHAVNTRHRGIYGSINFADASVGLADVLA